MKLEAIINDNYEIDYYEAKQKKGTTTKHITVRPENDYFDVKEVVYNGTKVIYANEFIIDNDLINAINNINNLY